MPAEKLIRADVRRNRERLLAAAQELFAEPGADVTREAVAKRAGVGVGTVYRHFPSRDALVEAACRSDVAELCAGLGRLLGERPPDAALAEWMDGFVEYAAARRGMAEALRSAVASGSDVFADTRRQFLAAVTAALQAGAADGSLRPDVDADVVLGALSAVAHLCDEPEHARRVLGLVVDGLRPRP
jgi:AcrR family transcriptional regulator